MRSKLILAVIILLFAGVVYAYSDAVAGGREGVVTDVLMRAEDYTLAAPDTISEGLTRIRLRNDGQDYHHVQLLRIEDGRTFEEFRRHAEERGEFLVPWVTAVGGPNVPPVNGTTEVLVDLEPGHYVVLCMIPTDGEPHFMKGMMRSLVVVDHNRPAAKAPDYDVRITLDNYWFAITPKLTAGRHTIRVENRATQPHEVVLFRMQPGKTADDVMKFFETEEGPPPFEVVGGATAIERGVSNYIVADITPGDYVLICFIPDAKDGRPHVAHGMIDQIRVD